MLRSRKTGSFRSFVHFCFENMVLWLHLSGSYT